jgi:NTP pyrophosphatase (non-canonical NTP hydrolase)
VTPFPSADAMVSDQAAESLGLLQEECAEVIQVASKIDRFGLRVNPYTGKHNRDELHKELGDVLAQVRLLAHLGIVDLVAVAHASETKLAELREKPEGRLHTLRVPDDLPSLEWLISPPPRAAGPAARRGSEARAAHQGHGPRFAHAGLRRRPVACGPRPPPLLGHGTQQVVHREPDGGRRTGARGRGWRELALGH